jgi:hypothetical protein
MKISKRKSLSLQLPRVQKPRNPLVAVALLRKAGSHRRNHKSLRAQHKQNTLRAIHEADSHE